VTRNGTTYCPCYDANGNITDYVDTNGAIAAHYEFPPFGVIVVQSGDLADSFTHRFSTKPWCAVTGVSEYELRMYSPELGRWLSRDPIGETGGTLLYCFLNNNALYSTDILGLLNAEYSFVSEEVQKYNEIEEMVVCGTKWVNGKCLCAEPCTWQPLYSLPREMIIQTSATTYNDRWNREEEAGKAVRQIGVYFKDKIKDKAQESALNALTKLLFGKVIPLPDTYESEATLIASCINYLIPPIDKMEYPKGSGNYYTVSRGVLERPKDCGLSPIFFPHSRKTSPRGLDSGSGGL
jgi:RHS repeat-associated protein